MSRHQDKLADAKTELESYLSKHRNVLLTVGRSIKRACDKVEKSSSGSWAGYHASLYFKNYQAPNIKEQFNAEWGGAGYFSGGYDPGWQPRDLDDVWGYIQGQLNIEFDIDQTNDELDDLVELGKSLRDILNLYTHDSGLQKKLEKNGIGFSIGDYIKIRTPSQVISRDSKAMYQGIKVPPHIQCMGFGESILINIKAASELTKIADLVATELSISDPKKFSIWHFTNPFWLTIYSLKGIVDFITKYKIAAAISGLLAILGLVAADYSLAWNNIHSIAEWLTDLF